MLVLAIDTCDENGSVSVLKDGAVVETIVHSGGEGYSSWLLPTVDQLLAAAAAKLSGVDVFAVATGPGSFTGVRIGLTTVKAWGEVFGKPIAAMSRLEVLASECQPGSSFVASFIDAQRGQIFGALYTRDAHDLELAGEEVVTTPKDFLERVTKDAEKTAVGWVSTTPRVLEDQPLWPERALRGETILQVPHVLAPLIGKLGIQKVLRGDVRDALSLDANYVRRSYVEMPAKPAHEA
ncbi:MAG: tRNA (adenosine(37)-N6)-threonylcarbamoyltransferase complex dimerization subunit type 1 TsaB [Acidobacteriota bacterium]|nr:tRNA (adenosine(37)-N6)-threonylcarbamoyltransferase complex dimerization subunit type 1 TsaB [Acidobacteriota bacterium]